MAKEKLTKKQLEKKELEQKKRKSEYMVKLIKESYKRFEIRFKLDSESDIIEHLASKPSVQAYIKKLIRNDMGK